MRGLKLIFLFFRAGSDRMEITYLYVTKGVLTYKFETFRKMRVQGRHARCSVLDGGQLSRRFP